MGYLKEKLADVDDGLHNAADAVGDVATGVAQGIEGALESVGDFVTQTIEAALDDPVTTILKVAAVASGSPQLLPLIDGAKVAVNGGDVGDILEATAKAYVVQQVATGVGNYARTVGTANELGTAIGSQQSQMLANQAIGMGTEAAIADSILGYGAASAVTALAYDQDPIKAFITGGVSGATSAIAGNVEGLGGMPKPVQFAIMNGIAAKLTGGDVTNAMLLGAAKGAEIGVKVLQKVDPKNQLTAAQQQLIVDVVDRGSAAFLTGGNVSGAVANVLVNAGAKAVGQMVKDGFKDTVSNVEKQYKLTEEAAAKLDTALKTEKTAVDKYNELKTEWQSRTDSHQRSIDSANNAIAKFNANPTADNKRIAENAIDAANRQGSVLTIQWNNTYKKQFDALSSDITEARKDIALAQGDYDKFIGALTTATDSVQQAMEDAYTTSDRAFVLELNPEFDAAVYARSNDLGGKDPYAHYLEEGMFTDSITTVDQEADAIAAEKTRLISEAVKQTGGSILNLSNDQISALSSTIDAATNGNLERLRSASIQDILGGRAVTDIIRPGQIEVRGAPIMEETKDQLSSGASIPDGYRLATSTDVQNNIAFESRLIGDKMALLVQDGDMKNRIYDASVGDFVTVMPTAVVTAKSLEDMAADDPEAALVVMSEMEKEATGGLDYFVTTMANSMMLAAYASGNEEFGDAVKQGLSLTTQAVGEQVSSFATFIADQTGMSYDNALIKAGQALQAWGADKQSASTVQQEQNIINAAKNAEGFWGTIADVGKAIIENPGGFGTLVAKEGIQELMPLAAAKWAQRFGRLAAHSANAAMEFAESYGGNGLEAYNAAIASGKSEAEARRIAGIVGLQAGAVTLFTSGVGDAPIVDKVIREFGRDAAANFTAGVVREGVTEFFDESLGNAAAQYQLTGNVNWSNAWTAGAVASAIGAGTAGTLLAGFDIANNSVIGRDAAGNQVTMSEFLAGTKQPTSVDFNATIGTNANGTALTLADVGAVGTASGLTDVIDAAGQYNTQFRSAANNASSMSMSEARTYLESQGYTNPTNAEVTQFVNSNEIALTARDRATAWADPKVTSAAEAQQMMRDLGYTNMTDAEAQQLAGKISEADAKKNITTYVDQHTVTPDELRDKLRAENPTITDREIAAYAQQGANVNQDQVIANATASVDASYRTELEVRDRFRDLGLENITAADAAKFVGTVGENDTFDADSEAYFPTAAQNLFVEYLNTGSLPGMLTEEGVADIVSTQLVPLVGQMAELQKTLGAPEGNVPTTADTLNALKTYLKKPGFEEYNADYDWNGDGTVDLADVLNLQKAALGKPTSEPAAEGLPWGQPTGIYKYVADQIATLPTDADISSAINTALADYATTGDVTEIVNTALRTTVGTFPTEDNPAGTGLIAELVAQGATVEEIQAQLGDPDAGTGVYGAIAKAREDGTNALDAAKESLQTQIGTPATTDADGNPVEATGIYAAIDAAAARVQENVLAKMEEYELAGIDRDTALDQAITDVAGDLGKTKEAIQGQIGTPATTDEDGNPVEATGIFAAIEASAKTVQENVLSKVAEYEAAGMARDEALDQAIADVASDLGLAQTAIQNQIGTPAGVDADGNPVASTGIFAALDAQTAAITADVQAKYDALTAEQKALADQLTQQGIDLNTAINTVRGELGAQIDEVAAAVGKPARSVTQDDIDYVNNILQGTAETDMAYDANQDGVVDQTDIDLLTDVLAGTTPQWLAPADTVWAPTGLYQGQQQLQEQIAQEAEQTRQAAAANARALQLRGAANTFSNMILQSPDLQGQKVQVKAPDPTKIGYVYDWSSIFANPTQQQLFTSPFGASRPVSQAAGFTGFARGGMVTESDAIDEELRNILRG